MSLDSMLNMIMIILGFGFLIGIHELGHFLAAKWAGIRTNAFAIGMGPQIFSYRKGVGFCYKSTKTIVIKKFGKDATEMSDDELNENGLSETEYSLRLLPIGGFVSMLGQEDANPDAVSEDPRSYNKCPIGKRMVVVSAGVIMNALLACFLFLICFQIGVNFEAPIIGAILPDSPAARTSANGYENLTLQSGDTVITIDGKEAKTFMNLQIAGAMAKPGKPVVIEVKREGLDTLLTYSMTPSSVSEEGILELGVFPASSLVLRSGDLGEQVMTELHTDKEFLPLKEGMHMVSANGKDIDVWSQFNNAVEQSGGNPVQTNWEAQDGIIEVSVPVSPKLNVIRLVDVPAEAPQNYERGFFGMCPLARITSTLPTSPNSGLFQSGDVVLKVASLEAPRMGQLRNFLSTYPDGVIDLVVLRNGKKTSLQAEVKSGKLGILLKDAMELPFVAQPLQRQQVSGKVVPTRIANYQLLGGSEIVNINGHEVSNWKDIRNEFIAADESISIALNNPTKGNPTTEIDLQISQQEHQDLAALGWSSPLAMQMFDPIYIVRSSGGNPIKAVQMGFDETVDMLVMTYLTIDRLLRRSIGVDQLRGPVGIIHIGSKIADRGYSYLFFFFAIISVNLAVLNFLPLPIVDGGLFLYLVYEKLFKKPPSIAFQNAAAVLGLGLIATLFLVTFYNDIARLLG